jgi:hypothetical protein
MCIMHTRGFVSMFGVVNGIALPFLVQFSVIVSTASVNFSAFLTVRSVTLNWFARESAAVTEGK